MKNHGIKLSIWLSWKWITQIIMIENTWKHFFKGMDTNKTNDLCDFILCYCNYFFDINFIYQSCVCNWCHYLMQKTKGFNDVVIVSVEVNDCRILGYKRSCSHNFTEKFWFKWKKCIIVRYKKFKLFFFVVVRPKKEIVLFLKMQVTRKILVWAAANFFYQFNWIF